jgi:hypothetical protein
VATQYAAQSQSASPPEPVFVESLYAV